jgi:hypothetical protein
MRYLNDMDTKCGPSTGLRHPKKSGACSVGDTGICETAQRRTTRGTSDYNIIRRLDRVLSPANRPYMMAHSLEASWRVGLAPPFFVFRALFNSVSRCIARLCC